MHFTAACHCWYCWILTHPLWDGYSYGPGKPGHCFEQKRTYSSPQVTRFVSFNPLRTEGFFVGMGGVGGLPCALKLLACKMVFCSLARPVLNRWARRFWSRKVPWKAHTTQPGGTEIGDGEGMWCFGHQMPFQRWTFLNEMTWSFIFGSN